MARDDENLTGMMQSPGGFIFGVQGWTWGEPRPRSITFFLDGTAKVCDQWGRPIRGTVVDNKQVKFAQAAPQNDEPKDARSDLATHAQVIAALAVERIDWLTLSHAGWPQLPYAELKKMPSVPPTPLEELRKIKDPTLRKDALRMRREVDEEVAKEMAAAQEE